MSIGFGLSLIGSLYLNYGPHTIELRDNGVFSEFAPGTQALVVLGNIGLLVAAISFIALNRRTDAT